MLLRRVGSLGRSLLLRGSAAFTSKQILIAAEGQATRRMEMHLWPRRNGPQQHIIRIHQRRSKHHNWTERGEEFRQGAGSEGGGEGHNADVSDGELGVESGTETESESDEEEKPFLDISVFEELTEAEMKKMPKQDLIKHFLAFRNRKCLSLHFGNLPDAVHASQFGWSSMTVSNLFLILKVGCPLLDSPKYYYFRRFKVIIFPFPYIHTSM